MGTKLASTRQGLFQEIVPTSSAPSQINQTYIESSSSNEQERVFIIAIANPNGIIFPRIKQNYTPGKYLKIPY